MTSLSLDSKRSRQPKLNEAFGTNVHLFAFLDGVTCHSRAGAYACSDSGSFSASQQCPKASTSQRTDTSGLPCLLGFTLSAKLNDVAGDRIAVIAHHNTFQLKLQFTATFHTAG